MCLFRFWGKNCFKLFWFNLLKHDFRHTLKQYSGRGQHSQSNLKKLDSPYGPIFGSGYSSLWEVVGAQEAVNVVRPVSDPVLAAKKLQDLAQSYGCEENLSVLVLRLHATIADPDPFVRELRSTLRKAANQVQTRPALLVLSVVLKHQMSSKFNTLLLNYYWSETITNTFKINLRGLSLAK